jgi:methionine-R-sulfoxide reductase
MTIRKLFVAAALLVGSSAALADRPVSPVRAKPSIEQLRKELTQLQFHVTQENGTERAFKNEYWDTKEPGLYVDIMTGEPLFSSQHKFDSGTGWPSFWQPIAKGVTVEKTDKAHGMVRVEVRSKLGDAHLGHVFDDGPKPTGQRFCINSASLRFIPVSELAIKGYITYVPMFVKK